MNTSNGCVPAISEDSYWKIQDQDVICVPSLTLDEEELHKITACMHYEERQLYNLMLLKNPNTRIIFLSSVPVPQEIVDYYTTLINLSKEEVKKRLIMISMNDSSSTSLVQKILDRPDIIQQIKTAARPNLSLLLCFNATSLECDLAKRLGVPIFGHECGQEHWGSKSGSREIFAEANVPHPQGVNLTHSAPELAESIACICPNSKLRKFVVKLDFGFSGEGNAILDLSHLSPKDFSKENILREFANLQFSSPVETWAAFEKKIATLGAIAEEFIEGEDPKCPSVQGCISPKGKLEILSTHEQVLNGQIYQGCHFPASNTYRREVQEYGRRVGDILAKKGVKGHFGVDFLISGKDIFALEINLRQCGTTHPYFTMKLLTNGTYDSESGLFYSVNGCPKYYTASDNLNKDQYKGLKICDFLDIITRNNLGFHEENQCGSLFHLLGALPVYGKFGVTCIANSSKEAHDLMQQIQDILDREIEKNSALPSGRAAK